MAQPTENSGYPEPKTIDQTISLCRLLVGCFALAPAIFGVIVLAMNAASGPIAGANAMIGQILGGVAAVLLLVNAVIGAVRWRLLAGERDRGEAPSPARVTSAVIVRGALVEGPALLGAVAALLGGSAYLFVTLAGCALLVIMWVRMPDDLRNMVGALDRNPYRWER